MACVNGTFRNQGVVNPVFRIEVNTKIFEKESGFIESMFRRMKIKNLPLIEPTTHYLINQLFANTLSLIDLFKVMGSGSYVFCTIKGSPNFKLLENEVEMIREKFREVPVLTNTKKMSELNLELHLYYFNQRTILEYLFFVMLYRFRVYTTFTVKVDYVNRMFFTTFSYDFVDCVIKTAETNFEQELDGFGNVVMTQSKPLKFILTLIPYDIRIRI